MRNIFLTLVLVLAAGCTSVTKMVQLNDSLNRNMRVLNQERNTLVGDFYMRSAQYRLVSKRTKGLNLSAVQALKSSIDTLSSLKQSFLEESTQVATSTTSHQERWNGRVQITSKDPEWNELQHFQKNNRTNFDQSQNTYREYKKQQQHFDAILSGGALTRYAQDLPKTPRQAMFILQKLEREAAYNTYNANVLANLKHHIDQMNMDFESLVALCGFPSDASVRLQKYGAVPAGYTGPTEETNRKAAVMISAVINSNIINAARVYLDSRNSPTDIADNLKAIQLNRYASLRNYTSPTNYQELEGMFSNKRHELIKALVNEQKAKSTGIIGSSQSGLEKLRQLVTLREDFGKQYRDLLGEPQVIKYLSEAKNQRFQLLKDSESDIDAFINAAKSVSQIGFSSSRFLAPEDQDSAIARRITKLLADKRTELTTFVPVFNENQLGANTFTAKGLNYETELTALYLGDFKHSRLKSNSMATAMLFESYLKAFGAQCDKYLPADKVEMTYQECAEEEHTVNGFGEQISPSTCVRWRTVGTGIYADPTLYSASNRIIRSASGRMFMGAFTGHPMSSRGAVDDALNQGHDMERLVRMNKCGSAGLQRFQTNLYRFAMNEKPILLPGKETLASVRIADPGLHDASSQNFTKLLDDLIVDNSRGWMLNRYVQGSISNLKIKSVNADGSPSSVVATYKFTNFGKYYKGRVTLRFSNDLPECLYFSDAPSTCRHPSRKIITAYEKGRYH